MPPFDPTQPQPYPGPVQGYSWAGQPPQSMNPFATAGTSMIQDYAMMRQNEQVRQYQQMMTPPANMSMNMQAAVAYSPQYNFGVVGGQMETWQNLQRQQALSSGAFSTMGAAFGIGLPLFSAGDAAAKSMLSAAGLATKGMVASPLRFLVGGAAGMAATYPLQMIAQRGIDRARWSSNIEADIESYSGRWTGGTGFGRPETRALASDMMRGMQDTQDFFRPQDQMKIHKMGLASGMLKGRGTDEYKRNFEDLKANVKDIVQLMNTTVEGGLSVMNELKGAGFNSPAAIRNQVMQAKSWGTASGVGTQNMLSLGAAGAQAAIGTGWSAQSAATMYQGTATVISQMAQGNAGVANAVRGMGGIANAGAATANSMMNVMRSGMGTQVMAYMMDPNTRGIDRGRMANLLEGRVGSMDIIAGANRYGLAGGRGGANNRVLFEKYSRRNWNQMNLMEQAGAVRSTYEAWAGTRGGVDEASSNVFARMFTSTPEQADVFAELLLNPSQMANLKGSRMANEYMLRAAGRDPRNRLMQGLGNMAQGAQNVISRAGDTLYGTFSGMGRGLSNSFVNQANRMFGYIDPSGMVIDRTRLAPSQAYANQLYGASTMTTTEIARMRELTTRKGTGWMSAKADMNKSFDSSLGRIIGSTSSNQLTEITEMWAQANMEGKDPTGIGKLYDALDLRNNPELRRKLKNSYDSKLIFNSFSNNVLKGNTEYSEGAKTLNQWKSEGAKSEGKLDLMRQIEVELNHKIHAGKGMNATDAFNDLASTHPRLKGNKAMESAARAFTGVTKNVIAPTKTFAVGETTAEQAGFARAQMQTAGQAWKQSKWRYVPLANKGFWADEKGATLPKQLKGRETEWKVAISGKTEADIIKISEEQFGITGDMRQGMNLEYWANRAGKKDFMDAAATIKSREDTVLMDKFKSRKGYLLEQTDEKYRAGAGKAIDQLLSKDFASADLGLLAKAFPQLGKANFQNADKAANAIAGAIKNSSETGVMEDILKDMKDELVKANELVTKGVGKDGKTPLTAAEKETAKKDMQTLASNIANVDQKAAQSGTSQDAQTAAPNILNYWNNKWMM